MKTLKERTFRTRNAQFLGKEKKTELVIPFGIGLWGVCI